MSETPQSKNKQGAIGASTAKNSQKSNYHSNAQHSDGGWGKIIRIAMEDAETTWKNPA